MKEIDLTKVKEYITENISSFHERRLQSLRSLKLEKVLKRKNPYLFKAKNILKSQDFVQNILDAHLSSQEETIFGEFLEGLAIFVNERVFNGKKSTSEGIDLEFENEKIHYIVSVKSGPNWGNSEQIRKMIDSFNRAKQVFRTSGFRKEIIAVNGCCYGRNKITYKKAGYYKYCGQKFWEFISGNRDLYLNIIKPLGVKAKEKNEKFYSAYCKIINLFTDEFNKEFCINGEINWDKLVKLNSAIEDPLKPKIIIDETLGDKLAENPNVINRLATKVLKEICRFENLKIGGNKTQLIERIRNHFGLM